MTAIKISDYFSFQQGMYMLQKVTMGRIVGRLSFFQIGHLHPLKLVENLVSGTVFNLFYFLRNGSNKYNYSPFRYE